MITARLPIRNDLAGLGHYGARRGRRKHKGIDHACLPGTEILSPVTGKVTKRGYPYSDDLTYRYVEITDNTGHRHRLFYIQPLVSVDEVVAKGDLIGTAQDVTKHNPDKDKPMIPHVHYEVKTAKGRYVDPSTF